MRSKNRTLSVFLALSLSAGGAMARADAVNDGSPNWQSWNTGNLVANSSSQGVGTPYWNNASGDGPMDNVGWCLAGGGNCTMPAGTPGALSYYGTPSGSAGTMYFTNSGYPVTLTLQTLLTTQTSTANGYDLFGYYVANNTGNAPSGVTLNAVFDSRSSTVGNSYLINTLTAGEKYGFYIENIQGGGTSNEADYFYFMDSSSNTSTGAMPADSDQHFAVFNGSYSTYFLGDVDGDACSGDYTTGTSPCVPASQFDYNNMVVEVATSTPEPGTLALMGAGLCVVAVFIRRKKNSPFEN